MYIMKKLISFILMSALVILTGTSVFAEDSQVSEEGIKTEAQLLKEKEEAQKKLTDSIVEIKDRIKLSSKFNVFEYDVTTRYGFSYYTFKWLYAKPDEKFKDEDFSLLKIGDYRSWENNEKFIELEIITVNYIYGTNYADGIITSYQHYDKNYSSYGKMRFAKLSDVEMLKTAQNYTRNYNPGIKGTYTVEADGSQSLTNNERRYSVKRSNDGLDISFNGGYLRIDRDTGRLIEMRMEWWNDLTVPQVSKAISIAEVQEIYKKSTGKLNLSYQKFNRYDKEKQEYISEIKLVYNPEKHGMTEIDALTGKKTSIYDDIKYYSKTDSYEWNTDELTSDAEIIAEAPAAMEESSDNAGLSEAELAELEKKSVYLTKEEALNIIKKDKYIVFNSELIESGASLSNYTNPKGELTPLWQLNYRFSSSDKTKDGISLNVSMDAITGDIIRFSKNYSYAENSKNIPLKSLSQAAAEKIAEEAGAYYTKNTFREYESESIYYDDYLVYNENRTDFTRYKTNANLKYTRYANNVPYYENYMNFKIDGTGELLSFGYNHEYDAEFPDASHISEEDAYKNLFRKMIPELYYDGFLDLQRKSHSYLTYGFDSTFTLNAKNGERLYYDGTAFYKVTEKKDKKEIVYTDIKGHKNEEAIKTLLDYSIIITEDSKFKPDDNISILEFALLMSKIDNASYWNNIIWTAERQNSPEWDPKQPKTDYSVPMTKAEFAKAAINIKTGSAAQTAEIPGIFFAPFNDVGTKSRYCGYIAMANYYGYVQGVSATEFKPGLVIKKGTAMQIVYDYLHDDQYKDFYILFSVLTGSKLKPSEAVPSGYYDTPDYDYYDYTVPEEEPLYI